LDLSSNTAGGNRHVTSTMRRNKGLGSP